MIPGLPPPSIPGLDPSWVEGLSMARARGLVPGKDILWTYGPLAFLGLPDSLTAPMWPPLIYRLALYLLWAAALLRLSLHPRNQSPIWSVLVVGLAGLIAPDLTGDPLELSVIALSALILLEIDRWRIVELACLSVLVGIALLGKVSLGLEGGAIFAGILVGLWVEGYSKKYILAAAVSLPAVTFAFFWTATGHPGRFLAYLRYTIAISAGYSASMSFPGPLWELIFITGSLVTLFVGLPFLADDLRKLAPAYLPAAAGAFLVYKHGVVRQVGNEETVPLRLVLLATLFAVCVYSRRYRFALAGFQIVSIIAGYLLVSNLWPLTAPNLRYRLSLQIGEYAHAYFHWPATWKRLQDESRKALSALQLAPEFDRVIGRGSVDAEPWNIAAIEANHWSWNPRPVIQSYSAYTPELDRANAEHLDGPTGADFILASWAPIDGRHPFFEDPLSWRTLLNRYRSDISDPTTLVMRRSSEARFEDAEPFAAGVARWGEEIRVPGGRSPILLSAGVRKSLYGTLVNFAFRSTWVWINVRRESGQTERYRAVAANLPSGFLIDPLPRNLAELNLVGQNDCVPSDRVTSLWFEAGHPGEFRSEIPLRWFRLPSRPLLSRASEKSGPCVVTDQFTRKFPSWGGSGRITVGMRDGASLGPQVKLSDDWIRPGGTGGDIILTENKGPADRRGSISVGDLIVPVIQAAAPTVSQSPTLELSVFQPDLNCPLAPPAHPPIETITVCRDSFGLPGDQPVMGDWTGTGVIRIGVFRDGVWYLDLNDNGKWDGVEGGDGQYVFGSPGDKAVVGDWKGDGITRLGIFRRGVWILDVNNNRKYDPDDPSYGFGLAEDLPVVGKWGERSGADHIGVFRKGTWYLDTNGNGTWEPEKDTRFRFGLEGDLPVVSHTWSRVGVYRSGDWYLDREGKGRYTAAGTTVVTYGSTGARPLFGEW